MQVFFSELAEEKLIFLTEYLLENWGQRVKTNFLIVFKERIEQISINPESCPKSNEFGGIYKCVVSKQTSFYYRILFNRREIEIITIFDTRQNPDKLNKQLKP